MFAPILATKLYIPPLPPRLVLRPRLTERLQGSLCAGCKLNLISAPAGFGKTTLASQWALASGRPAAWLSLDEGDNDPSRFLAYLVAALQTILPGVGESIVQALQDAQPPPMPALLTSLLNDLAVVPTDCILVLDDYHLIDAPPVDEALAFLLEHLPPRMHLVITTREDPALPLARLRARDQLTEVRAADLRFTPAEAAEFLHAMRLDLMPEEVAALDERTEGWVAGLQLAAIALRSANAPTQRQDLAEFIRAFAGSHRYIMDYLVAEVLQQQPPAVRSFLLQTAILDRLSGPLCEAVTGQAAAGTRLEALERGNFFIIPLDERRQWYRYHHLFAEVLAARLLAERPAEIPTLHRRASEWCEQHGALDEAIRHALAGGDFERAADLVERGIPALRQSRQDATLLGRLAALPDDVLRRRPVLNVYYASALLAGAQLAGVEARLRDAEHWLDGTADPRGMVVVDQDAFRRLPGSIAMFRAGIALLHGDVDATSQHARRALDLAPAEDDADRGGAAALLGLACWTRGELDAAHRSYADGMALLQRAGHVADAINGSIALANIRITQGRLRDALATYERGLQLAEQGASGPTAAVPGPRGAADMHVGIAQLLCERNELDAAQQHLLRSRALGEHAGMPQNRYRWCVALARLREAQGDLDASLDLLAEAERLYVSDFSPNVRPIPALRVRVWIKQGRLSEALDWIHQQRLSPWDELSYLREFEHVTLARLLLAQHRRDHADGPAREVSALLARLLQAAEAGGRMGSVVELLALQALTHHTQADLTAARVPLARSLALAEPEGYVRLFVDEGAAMAALLREAARHAQSPAYVRRLLAAFEAEPGAPVVAAPPVEAAPLVEQLSARELEVLRLLGTELSGPELADKLIVSLNTLRTHTKNIYGKLGVSNRRAAVLRAEEIGLL